jgi:DNA topoisomerase-2
MIFINCLIDNPSFDSQTKENLTTKVITKKYIFVKVSEFGGEASEKFTVSDKFAKSLLKTDIIEAIVA